MLKIKNLSYKWILFKFKNLNENQILKLKENFKQFYSLIKKINYFYIIDYLVCIIIFKNLQNIFFLNDILYFFKNNKILNLNIYIVNFLENKKSSNEITLNKISLDEKQNPIYSKYKDVLWKNIFKSMQERELLKQSFYKLLNTEKIKNIKKLNNSNNKIIVLKNIFKLKLGINQILNLFTSFGNISKIFVNYINGFIYIQFNKTKDIKKINKYKNNLKYKNKLIKLDYFHHSKIRKNPFEKYLIRMIKFEYNKNRYHLNLNIKFNPPNNKIIILNIENNIKISFLFKLITQFSIPLKLKFISNKTNNTKMCIVWLESIEDSIKVIMNLHNYKLNKLIWRVSFSFYRI